MSNIYKRPDQPQWSLSGDDVKQQDSKKCAQPQSQKKFVEQRNVINQSDFLSPDVENIGREADLHKDCDDYNRKMYGNQNRSKTGQTTQSNQPRNQPQKKQDACK